MDGVSWSTTRSEESFSRSSPAADTLSRLASFIARADTKQHTRSQKLPPSNLSMLVCSECGKGFNYAADLLQHQEDVHTLPKPHRCPSCGQEFSLRSSLQLHKCDHSAAWCELCHGVSRTGSPCLACASRTSDPLRPQDKSLHRQPHILDSSPYTCAPCGRGFSQKQALLHHQQAGCSESPSSDTADASSLPDDSPPVSEGDCTRSDSSDTPGPSSRTLNVCHFCSRTFRTEAALQRHKLTNHQEEDQVTKKDRIVLRKLRNTTVNGIPNERPQSKRKLLTCRSCDMVFKSTSKLYMHRKEKHSREQNIGREQSVISRRKKGYTYPCQICSKVFFHHLSLKAHYRQHAAASLTSKSQSIECTTKDFTLLRNGLNQEETTQEDNKAVKAGPGRPRKFSIDPDKHEVSDPGTCREVTEVEEEEEDQDEEEEEEEEGGREFPCPSCAEVFSLQWELKEHVELHQASVRRRQCSVCTNMMDTCKWPSSKRQRLYHCVPCQQGFSALDSFLEHCQEHLRVRVEQDSIMECYAYQASKA